MLLLLDFLMLILVYFISDKGINSLSRIQSGIEMSDGTGLNRQGVEPPENSDLYYDEADSDPKDKEIADLRRKEAEAEEKEVRRRAKNAEKSRRDFI